MQDKGKQQDKNSKSSIEKKLSEGLFGNFMPIAITVQEPKEITVQEPKEITSITVGEVIDPTKPYDVEKYGPLIDYKVPVGCEEVEKYWVTNPYVLVSIQYEQKNNDYVYKVITPDLSAFEIALLEDIHEHLIETLRYEKNEEKIDRSKLLAIKVKEYIDRFAKGLDYKTFYKILYFVNRNSLGYGRIDPLLKDPYIEDISCNGPNIPIYLYHRKYENIKTNIIFSEHELNSFVIKLAQRCGKHISVAVPYADATMSDGSRLQTTLGKEITSRGSSFTIRKFKESPLTPVDLISFGTFSSEMMAYLWLCVENNKSMMIVGGTACGKTSSLNAVSLFIPPKSKIVTIEDTRELQLYHENWIASLVRESYTEAGKDVDMYELLRQGLRQRPEYLLVGEVRGSEALTLFQAMSTGHATYSTMHAGTVQAAVNRLESEPISVPRVMLASLDLMIIQALVYIKGKRVRRVQQIAEFLELDPGTSTLNIITSYSWNPISDSFNSLKESPVLEQIRAQRGWDKNELKENLELRKEILEYMVKNNIRDYVSVSDMLKVFWFNPEKVLEILIKAEKSDK